MALRHTVFISFASTPGALDLTRAGILIDEQDHEGIRIAANILRQDIVKVIKGPPPTLYGGFDKFALGETATSVIIIGCIETSRVLWDLEQTGKTDYGNIRGKWESFSTCLVEHPVPGCERALVIAGSDKRGTIYGIYTLSEQLGVSPWYWWADVPPAYHPQIYALPITTHSGEPSIRYRGIFINDEAPALTGWVREKFGGYNVTFYKKVFELLLRLRANFLWPAMWPGFPNPGASFFTDDPENQRTADVWGIVVSTSHHEPMQRLANEWLAEGNPLGTWDWLTNKDKITSFFERGAERAEGFESYFTLGMRGEYDTKMRTDDPAAVVRDVLATQRSLIKKVYGREDAVPQLLALYKEVQVLYESGQIEVPNDVTLLFSDDNFGSIRRLPSPGDEEGRRQRKGGAGIYYHFEYVGTPRSYKWINSNSLGKTWHQLHEAHRRGARQIWVFNVGDIKPLEVPLTFAMTLAWDMTSNVNANPATAVSSFLDDLAWREFGGSGVEASQISKAWLDHDRLLSLRRHEHIEPETFSLLHYNEAESISLGWRALSTRAEEMYGLCRKEYKPAFFQLVVHPIKASAIFTTLHITRARNRLYARQRRTSTNRVASAALELFDADFDLMEEYHGIVPQQDPELLGGAGAKWNGILAQPHYGFIPDTWHAPSRDMLEGLCYVQTRQASNAIVGNMGVMVQGHAGVRPGVVNENSDFMRPSKGDLVEGLTLGEVSRYSTGWDTGSGGSGSAKRWIELYSRGTCEIHWSAKVIIDGNTHHQHDDDDDNRQVSELRRSSWVRLSRTKGTFTPEAQDTRVDIGILWDHVPVDYAGVVRIEISSDEGDLEHVHLPLTGRCIPEDEGLGTEGMFVEADGYVAMAATAGKEVKKKMMMVNNDNNKNQSNNNCYRLLPHVGRTLTGAIALDPNYLAVTDRLPFNEINASAEAATTTALSSPHWLEYPFFLFTDPLSADRCTLMLNFTLTLESDPYNPMMYEYAIDAHGPVHRERLVPPDTTERDVELPAAEGWVKAVKDCVWQREHDVCEDFGKGGGDDGEGGGYGGRHVLRLRLLHTNILLERVVLDLGGVKEESYLGPPGSIYSTGG